MRAQKGVLGAAAALAALSAAPVARASLTASEQAQLRAFVAAGQVENAARVRAMVARTDLTADESTQALKDATTPVAFDEAHQLFVREMLFGPTSAAARPVLVPAATRALLARADAVYGRPGADLDQNAKAQDEVSRIYRFIDAEIAGAGQPKGDAHDPQMGIPPAAYDECAKALAQHVELNARWLKGDAAVPGPVVRVRAQLQLALVRTLTDSLTKRSDAADKLGLAGARRKFFLETGALLVDAGRADDGRVLRARGLLDRLPLLKTGVAMAS